MYEIAAGGATEEASCSMKLVYQVLLYNFAILVGCFVAMLLAPDNTPYLLFFGCCALAFIAINVLLFVVPRYRKIDPQKTSKSRASSAIAWWVIGPVLLANFLFKYGHRLFR